MNSVPAPRTFAEGQRYIYGLLASAAGMSCGVGACAMISLLMWGGFSRAEEHGIVTFLAGPWGASSLA